MDYKKKLKQRLYIAITYILPDCKYFDGIVIYTHYTQNSSNCQQNYANVL